MSTIAPTLEQTLIQARLWVEASTAQVRLLSTEAAAPGEAMLRQIDEAIARTREAIDEPEKVRIAFETWANRRGLDTIRTDRDGFGRPTYNHPAIQAMWQGWIACATSLTLGAPA